MLGVVLARLARMMGGMGRMAVRRMRMVGGLLVRIGFMMPGGLAVVLGGVLVMLGGGVVVLDDLVLGHGTSVTGDDTLVGRCCTAVSGRCHHRWIVVSPA